jgi:excisionase family DNA binding protein
MPKSIALTQGASKLRNSELTEYIRRTSGNRLLKTESEIAAALGEKKRTIRSWRHAGVIPAVVLGHRTVRYKLSDVIAALEKRTVREVA